MPKTTEEQRKKAIREYHRLYRKNNPEKIKKSVIDTGTNKF